MSRYPHFGSPIDDGISHLRVAVSQYAGSGITNIGGAILALQGVGTEAASHLGPAIDSLSGGDPAVMKTTQFAWVTNRHLASLPNGATSAQSDLQQASALVRQMIDQYSQAYRLAQSLHYKPRPTHFTSGGGYLMPTPIPDPVPIELTWWQKIAMWLMS